MKYAEAMRSRSQEFSHGIHRAIPRSLMILTDAARNGVSLHGSQFWRLLPFPLAVVAFMVAYHSPNSYVGSDAQGTLLSAQSLLHYGTIRLDHYVERTRSASSGRFIDLEGNRLKFRTTGGHLYHFYPLGTVFCAAPFVLFYNHRGDDMLDSVAEGALQNLLSAATVAIAFLLVSVLSSRMVSSRFHVLLSVGLVFGSPLMSTMGTALWCSNLAAIFVLSILFLLIRIENGTSSASPVALGSLLFFAYLSRPSTLAFVVLTFLFVFRTNRRLFIESGAVFLSTFFLFMVFSYREFGQPLPDYYKMQRVERPTRFLLVALVFSGVFATSAYLFLKSDVVRKSIKSITKSPPNRGVLVYVGRFGTLLVFLAVSSYIIGNPWKLRNICAVNAQDLRDSIQAFLGILFSPSRGLFVYSPFLLVTAIGSAMLFRDLRKSPLFWICSVWLLFHALLLARPHRWHGGHCFGSRLFTEVFPAGVVLTLLVWERLHRIPRMKRLFLRGTMVGLLGFSIIINTYQGMFNRHTAAWNASPDIDTNPEYLYDWRHPQFLATESMIMARLVKYESSKTTHVLEETSETIPFLRKAPRDATTQSEAEDRALSERATAFQGHQHNP